MKRPMIPVEEYKERQKRAANLLREANLDVLLVNGSESDYANTRYFSGFWPLFERCGVAINADGETALLVGPESDIYAKDSSVIDDIFVLPEYRESADPSYPHLKLQNYHDVFKHLNVDARNPKIGVASVLDTNVVMWQGLQNAFPEAEIVDARELMVALRARKSDNEIECLREAARITHKATQKVIEAIRPGVTELQMVGVAQQAIYEEGAEYEGLPMYVFSGTSTRHAISRPSYRKIEKGDIVQLNLSAKVDGYSPSIGMPISIGPLSDEARRFVQFVWDMHRWTEERIAVGVSASGLARDFESRFAELGYEQSYVYGPCHGLGLIEVEPPWMETDSTFDLEENMTFQIDTFAKSTNYGVRWEKPIVVRSQYAESLAPEIGQIFEI